MSTYMCDTCQSLRMFNLKIAFKIIIDYNNFYVCHGCTIYMTKLIAYHTLFIWQKYVKLLIHSCDIDDETFVVVVVL